MKSRPIKVVGGLSLIAAIALLALFSAGHKPPDQLSTAPYGPTSSAPADGHLPLAELQARSWKWRKVRAEHLTTHPGCYVCGFSGAGVQVHHVKSFRFHPELELDPGNLITLCGPDHQNHHLIVGHAGRYDGENPHCREDAELLRQRYQESARIAREGKE